MLSYLYGSRASQRYAFYLVLVTIFLAHSVHSKFMEETETEVEPTTGQEVGNCTYTSSSASTISCNGEVYLKEEKDSGWRELFDLIMVIVLVLFAGMMSGLTMGLMSLDMTNLKIIAKSGDSRTQKYAKRIMPLVRKHHLLLVTLLTANAIAMEALPLFLDRLVGPFFAIVLSVTLVLFFGEFVKFFILFLLLCSFLLELSLKRFVLVMD